MPVDTLFLLAPDFADPAYPGTRFYCEHCAQIEGVLSYYPQVARVMEVRRISWPRPRAAVVALVGEDNQWLPLVVLGEGSDDHGCASGVHEGRRFISGKDGIARWFSARFGIAVPHP
ncbi:MULTISPECIES: DUF3088 domain-containing protein [Corallococcus]|uniref:DUF3088 domain-containing protein n=1 Tax=Corallococcus TaxID=83461 RepID=UPI00117E4AC1|nr:MULTISPECIES: DUF3088 domain-containing protein [Corallococcus]NBD08366.1 DUF3088 family protein [Corallococcus silvisoli]TSC34317.1 DUF3088 domain-containing protein [Corallococcus sp. Z5C101001]